MHSRISSDKSDIPTNVVDIVFLSQIDFTDNTKVWIETGPTVLFKINPTLTRVSSFQRVICVVL